MYYLMCKDDIRAKFNLHKILSYNATDIEVVGKLPIGCSVDKFTDWLESRNTAKHKEHLLEYLKQCNADNLEGFLRLTYGASLNDCFWVKPAESSITWSDVSLYKNEFNEVIQRLAFDGVGLCGEQLSSTSPEFNTDGGFPKCWKREDNSLYLYKRGKDFGYIKNLEPGCEALASQIFDKMSCGIPYTYLKYRNKPASRCEIFTSENLSYASYRLLSLSHNIDTIFKFYKSIGCEEFFRRLMVCDGIVLNLDRHVGNFGVLFNPETNEIVDNAPGFDYNLSLFPYTHHDEFRDIKSLLNKQLPKLSNDFIETARYFLTPKIKRELIDLSDLHFTVNTDDNFTKERVSFLDNIMHQQIRNILSDKSVYYTQFPVELITNIGRYKEKYKLSEDAFNSDIPRLMQVLDVKHMSELEDAIIDLL